MAAINDFGEKIGGAKKDLAQLRKNGGVRIEDIANWTEEERSQFITKNDIFPTPKYQQLYDSGEYSKEALYFIKKVRDSLATSPVYGALGRYDASKEQIQEAQDFYVSSLTYVKDILFQVKSENDINAAVLAIDTYREEQRINTAFTRKTNKALQVSSPWGRLRLIHEMNNKKFLYTDEEKLLADFTIAQYHSGDVAVGKDYYGDNHLSIKQSWGTSYYYRVDDKYMELSNWHEGTYFVTSDKQRGIAGFDFATYEDARQFVLDSFSKEEKKRPSGKKERFIPKSLEHIERTGEDYVAGRDITGDIMMSEFGFRGGEFGNWESQADRQTNLNMSYEAFKDMAAALGISDKDISLGGQLAIAYGARGSGSALAHYEPTANVINLTKLSGAGALGHEWGHALDHYVAKTLGRGETYETSKGARKDSFFADVMQAIKYDVGESKFYKDAQKMDMLFAKSDKGYWASNVEMFARAFHTYLLDKISPERSDYLCGHAEMQSFEYKGDTCYPYPVGADRERINKAFDHLIDKLKERGILHESSKEHIVNYSLEDSLSYDERTFCICDDVALCLSENNAYDKVADFFEDVIDAIEAYDKSGIVNIDNLIRGISFAEDAVNRFADTTHDSNNAFITSISEVMKQCAVLDISEKDKQSLFRSVEASAKKMNTAVYKNKDKAASMGIDR